MLLAGLAMGAVNQAASGGRTAEARSRGRASVTARVAGRGQGRRCRWQLHRGLQECVHIAIRYQTSYWVHQTYSLITSSLQLGHLHPAGLLE